MILSGKKRIIGVEKVVDEEEFDQFDDIPLFTTSIKLRLPTPNETPSWCNNHHEKVKKAKKNNRYNKKER